MTGSWSRVAASAGVQITLIDTFAGADLTLNCDRTVLPLAPANRTEERECDAFG